MPIARAAALAGGSAALESMEQLGLKVSTKTTGLDVVTNADMASQHAILSTIKAARPDDGFLGEEGGNRESSTGVTWVVDPIDSTANLVHSLPMWSVSVAAESEGVNIVGAVRSPMTNETVWGGAGCGLFINDESVPAPVSSDPLDTSLGLVGWPAGNREKRRGPVLAELIARSGRLRSPGSPALGLAWTAVGRADFAYYDQAFYAWDVAAGLALCTEAGLRIRLDRSVDGPHKLLVAQPTLFSELEEVIFG